MPSASPVLLEPRKSPVQARSAASVDAILDATIQVLLRVGMDRLTTTRVAARAGVSVGTLYQYFPNKQALLQAVSKRHMEGIAQVIERVCREQKGNSSAANGSHPCHGISGSQDARRENQRRTLFRRFRS